MNKVSVEKLLNDGYVFLKARMATVDGSKTPAVMQSLKYGEWIVWGAFPDKETCMEVIDNLVSNSNFKYLT